MLRATKPESPVLALLALLLGILAPRADLDGDGYTGHQERAYQCDPLDGASVPMCADADGDGIGETLPPAPQCDLYAYGMVPCA